MPWDSNTNSSGMSRANADIESQHARQMSQAIRTKADMLQQTLTSPTSDLELLAGEDNEFGELARDQIEDRLLEPFRCDLKERRGDGHSVRLSRCLLALGCPGLAGHPQGKQGKQLSGVVNGSFFTWRAVRRCAPNL